MIPLPFTLFFGFGFINLFCVSCLENLLQDGLVGYPCSPRDLSIITLNINGLNAPIKRLAEWIKKQDSYICCLQETHLNPRDTYRLKVKGWKKIFHTNGDQKKAGVAILISEKIDFEIKAMKRDKEGHYIMIKGVTAF